ncbi:MAG: hypothetical protein ACR2QH_03005 [Geminicoccaceae bacterium]
MTLELISEPGITVYLPAQSGDKIHCVIHADNNVRYEYEGNAVSDAWRTSAVWRGIRQEFSKGRQLLLATGKDIGDWLLNEPVQQWLAATLAERRAEQPRLRIELQVPPDLANIPWEIACVQGLSHLAVDPRLSVFRIKPEAPKRKQLLHDRLKVLLCGVKLEGHDHPEIETGGEINRIQQSIDQEYRDAEIDVIVDPLGDWQAIKEQVSGRRTPHVFHFAGHGLNDGRGLVF